MADVGRQALARRACLDPGVWVPRGEHGHEPLHAWQSRAVIAALELGGELSVEIDRVVGDGSDFPTSSEGEEPEQGQLL